MDQVGLSAGSALDFVSEIQSSKNSPGIIIANLGQLYWYRRGGHAVSRVSWSALPRKTAVSEQLRVHPVKNRIPGNEDTAAHVQYIFEEVVPQLVNKKAKLDILAIGEGASEAVEYLQINWENWTGRIHAIAVGTGQVWPGTEIINKEFALFWAKVPSPPTLSDPHSSLFPTNLATPLTPARTRLPALRTPPRHAAQRARRLRLQLLLGRHAHVHGMHHARSVEEHAFVPEPRA